MLSIIEKYATNDTLKVTRCFCHFCAVYIFVYSACILRAARNPRIGLCITYCLFTGLVFYYLYVLLPEMVNKNEYNCMQHFYYLLLISLNFLCHCFAEFVYTL